MRNRIINILLIFGCIYVGFAPRGKSKTTPTSEFAAPFSAQAFVDDSALLERRLPDVVIDDMPVHDAVMKLASSAKVDICVEWCNSPIGSTSEDHVSLALHNPTLREAILAAMGNGSDRNASPVHLFASNGIVSVTRSGGGAQRVRTEYIHIRPLLKKLFGDAASLDHRPNSGLTAAEMIHNLELILSDTIDPESWRDAGGTTGAITDVGGVLVITQSPENLASVHKVLDRLNESVLADDFPPVTRPFVAGAAPTDTLVAANGDIDPGQPVTEFFNVRRIIEESGANPPDLHPHRLPQAEFDWTPWRIHCGNIADLLMSVIDPESWKDNGGKYGAIRSAGNVMVITQTPKNMRLVRLTLDHLHEAFAANDFPADPGVPATISPAVIATQSAGYANASKTDTVLLNIRPLMAAFGAGRSVLTPSGEDSTSPTVDAISAIRTYIISAVDPDSWEATGGAIGRLSEQGGILAVTQTSANILKVRSALAHLNEAVMRNGIAPTTRHAAPTTQNSLRDGIE